MPTPNARTLDGRTQVVVFRNNGESTWMDFPDAKRVVAQVAAEWSKAPFNGQSYGPASDPWATDIGRGAMHVEPLGSLTALNW